METNEDVTTSFLDGLISPDTRRRTREQTQPLVDVMCSPLCIRSAVLTVGSALLLLTTLLIAISLTRTTDYEREMVLQSVPSWMLDQVTDELIRSNLEYLSSDLLEGRGTGTRGEELTVQYIATHFTAAGLSPAAPNGSFFQAVPLVSITPIIVKPLTLGPLTFEYPSQFTASSDFITHDIAVMNAEMVFVGYGIIAPSYNWDDYKGINVSGKVVVCLVNEPQSERDPRLFAGETLTYYGRWTYKIEQARAKGALGIVLIHTPETAGYGWQVVENSFAGEQVMLTDLPKNPLVYRGWINEDAATQLVSQEGSSLDSWISTANSPTFQPIPLTTRFNHAANYSIHHLTGTNVVATLGPPLDKGYETVVMMAHHDHLGIRPAVGTSTDEIYNGAVDNASGVAALIAAAYALGSLYRGQVVVAPELAPPLPQRTILFVSVTGEESNLLGSTHFTSHPPCRTPLCGATSALNFDIMNVWGETTDMVAIGEGMSKLMDQVVKRAASDEFITLVPDPTPHLGHLFRSDQLPFALNHVPSITLSAGTQYVGKPANYYDKVMEAYIAEHYHQPTDEYDESWSMAGVIQQTRMMLRIAYRLATDMPTPVLENNEILPPPPPST